MKKFLSFLSFLFLIALFHDESLAAQTVFKVGVLGPKTGESAREYGVDVFDGAQMAATEFNRKNASNGLKIEVIPFDDQGDMSTAQQGAYELIEKKVTAIIAAPTSWSSFIPTSISNASRTIFISAGSSRHIGRSGPFIFRHALEEKSAAQKTIRVCVEQLKYKNYAIITSMRDDEASLSIAGHYRNAIRQFGAKEVAQAFLHFDMTTTDAIAKLKKDAAAGLDAIIFTGGAIGAVEVLKELRKQGIKAPLIGSEKLYSMDFLNSAGARSVGTVIYTGYTPLHKSKETQRFIKKYRKWKKRYPTALVATSYDTMMLIAQAIKEGAMKEGVYEIRNALANIKDYKGVTGKISMDDQGETLRDSFVLQVKKKKKGQAFRMMGELK